MKKGAKYWKAKCKQCGRIRFMEYWPEPILMPYCLHCNAKLVSLDRWKFLVNTKQITRAMWHSRVVYTTVQPS